MPRTFKELPVDEQIKFINKELKKNSNMSLKKVCKNFGLNKIKINDKFSKAGYEYNADHRAYTKVLLMQKHNKSISNIKIKKLKLMTL